MRSVIQANKENLKYLFKCFWPFIIIEIIFSITNGASGAVSSYMSEAFVNNIVQENNLKSAMLVVIAVGVFILLKNIIQSVVKVYSNYVFSKVRTYSKTVFLGYTKQLNLSFFDIPENKNRLARADQYSNIGTEQFVSYVFSMLANIIGCCGILMIMSGFEWWLVVFLLILMSYRLAIDTIVSKKNFNFKKERVIRERRIGYFSNSFKESSILTDLHIYNGIDYFKHLFQKFSDENTRLQVKHNFKIEAIFSSTYLTIFTQSVVLYLYSGSALLNGSINIGEFTMLFSAVGYLNALLLNFKNLISTLYPIVLESHNYLDLVNIDLKYKYNSGGSKKNGAIDSIKTIEFKNVYFKYPQRTNYVLKNVSFRINEGETISLVGLNGCGKTTIIKLLLRLYEPTQGDILINGYPISEINIEDYWKLCGTVFQDFCIFPISAFENVSLSFASYENCEFVKKIMNEVDIAYRFEKEEMGIFTPLSRDFDENGTVLSGGEKQKIAFARASYKDHSLLILDEPSSALDAQAEQCMFDYLEKTKDNKKIIIFVSHRLSTSTTADRIMYIENGTISFSGSHDFMMNNCSSYKTLFEIQSSKYEKSNDKR